MQHAVGGGYFGPLVVVGRSVRVQCASQVATLAVDQKDFRTLAPCLNGSNMAMLWGGFISTTRRGPAATSPTSKAMLRRKLARRVGEDKTEQVTGKLQLYAITLGQLADLDMVVGALSNRGDGK